MVDTTDNLATATYPTYSDGFSPSLGKCTLAQSYKIPASILNLFFCLFVLIISNPSDKIDKIAYSTSASSFTLKEQHPVGDGGPRRAFAKAKAKKKV